MSKNEIRIKAVILECLPNLTFRAELENGEEVRAYLSGKMKLNRIKVIIGDKVELVAPEYGDIYRLVYRK